MIEPRRTNLWMLIAIAIVVCTIVFDVHADDGHGHDHGGEDILTGGDNTATNSASIAGSRSYGFGYGMGDVDLNQCMGSTQWGTILGGKQKLILNKWCAAESYDARGLHVMASLLRCDIEDIRKHFATDQGCIDANTMKSIDKDLSISINQEEIDDIHEEDISALYARLSDLEAQRTADTTKAEKAANRANAAAQRANQAESDRKEYAQEMLKELQEWD